VKRKHELYAPDKLTRTFEITGQVSVVDKITALLATMKVLGDWGSSRTISFDWDGDGHESFKMEVGSVDISEYFDPCQFVDDESMCEEHEGKGNESYIGAESMKRIDALVEAVEKGADPELIVERETAKQEALPPFETGCTDALEREGYVYQETQAGASGVGSIQLWRKGNRWIRLYEDGSWEAAEGSRSPTSTDFFASGDSCFDMLRDGWPDIVFY